MQKVTILRKWNNPQITITVAEDGIALEMALEDFLVALADEVAEPLVTSIAEDAGNPAFWFTKEALTAKLVGAIESAKARQFFSEAASRVIGEVKKESSKAV